MRIRTQTVLLALAGLILGFAAVTYASVSVPHLVEDLVEISVRPTLLTAVRQAMSLGVFMLVASTAVVIAEAVKSFRGLPVARATLAILGITLIVVGVSAFQASHSHHALGYSLVGAILMGAVFAK